MKQFALICTLLVLSYTTIAQRKSDRQKLGLIGNVKSIKETSYKEVEKFGEIVREKDRSKFWEYNFYYIFNKRGNKLIQKEYGGLLSSYESEYTFKYNRKGNIIKCNGLVDSDFLRVPNKFYKIFKYDNNNNIISEGEYTKYNHKLSNKYIYKYDNNNNLIEKNYYKSDGSLENKSKYKYNDKGQEIEENYYKSDGNLQEKYISKYNDEGYIIQKNTYKPDGSLSHAGTYKYDNRWNMINDSIFSYTYKYEYDKNGNWISKIEFDNNVKKHIIIRELEYFK